MLHLVEASTSVHRGAQFLLEQFLNQTALVWIRGRFRALEGLLRELIGEVVGLIFEELLHVLPEADLRCEERSCLHSDDLSDRDSRYSQATGLACFISYSIKNKI